jgi:hypothetical protein
MSGISFHEIGPHDRCKPLCGVVMPRKIALKIALVTTFDENFKMNRDSLARRSAGAGTGSGKPFKDTY